MKGLLDIAHQVADENAKRICNKVIRQLQLMPAIFSDEDSGLFNVWDKICVQEQLGRSYNWSSYLEIILVSVQCEVENLKAPQKLAIWLSTEEYSEWQDEDDNLEEPPVFDGDITKYLIDDYILSKARHWSNERIRNFSNRQYVGY